MEMHKSLALASGLLAFTVGSACAADPVSEAMHDWTGPYIGVNAGYAWGDQEQFEELGPSGSHEINGFTGGGQIGVNYQMGAFVLGAETDFQFSAIDGDFRENNRWACGPNNKCETQVDWFGTLRGRMGYAFDNVLPYVTGGLAYGHVESESGNNDPSNWQVSDDQLGWTLGGGVEMAFGEHFTGRIEYLYVDLGETSETGDYDFQASADFSVVRAGVNYAF